MTKPHVTRTYGPIHFEDLDPKRFEDLVRELIYDYKDWQKIEATGRSGSDGGFDIRAFEKAVSASVAETESGEEEEVVRTKEGNLWMIQGKREKKLGPSRIKQILKDVDPKYPAYGYILAASANFSRKSYDVFREGLQKKGVMEFHLWGKAELEDMLHQPKNDRILFTFFGISLVSRRRSRSTEIRSAVTSKNKILRTFGDPIQKLPFLLRDSNDTGYPYKEHYKDFKTNPRWKEYVASKDHPLGLVVGMYQYYAYVDHVKREYDFSPAVSLLFRQSDKEETKATQREMLEKVKDFWEHLPKANQCYFHKDGLLRFDQMLVIDDKGDAWHKFPHIYVDFGSSGPFAGGYEYVESENRQYDLQKYKKVKFFPKTFPKAKLGKLHKDQELNLERHFLYRISRGSEDFTAIYETDNRYAFLNVRDGIGAPHPDGKGEKNYIEITHKESAKVKDYLQRNPHSECRIEEQLGRKPDSEEVINIYEFKRTWEFLYDPERHEPRI